MDPDRDEATLEELDRALEGDPRNVELWRARGGVLCRAGRWAEALACLNRVMALTHGDVAHWHRWGVPPQPDPHGGGARRGSRWRESESLRAKARALAYRAHYGEAIDCYNRALDLAPGNGLAWRGKADILCRLGRTAEALACSDRALALNPPAVPPGSDRVRMHPRW